MGGVEATVMQLGRELVRRGHEVRVVCADEPDGSPARVEGIDVVRLAYRGKIGNTNLSWGLLRALRRERADVIHTHFPTAWWADAAGALAEETGLPLVFSYNNDLVGPGAKGAIAAVYNRLFLPRLLARSAAVITSNPVYSESSPHLAHLGDRLGHIPWGVDIERFSVAPARRGDAAAGSDQEVVLGFLALLDRHHRYKGLEELLRALAALDPNGKPWRLRVGGRGEEQPRYQTIAAELGIAERVEFLGFVSDEDLPNFYRDCHLFALPSTDGAQEGFGLVLLEAMACGRPVLTTPVVGMAAALRESGAGMLVPPRDIPALTAALESLRKEPEKLEGMGERARRLVEERYSWGRIADEYEALFARLASRQ